MSDLDRLSAIVEEIEQEEDTKVAESDTITLSNGVVMKAKAVPPALAQKIESRFVYPRVPKVFNPDKQRDEENPLDPDYIADCERIDAERTMAFVDLMVGLGTEVTYVPDNIPAFDSEGWREDIEFYLQESIPASWRVQYLYWVKFVLLTDQRDFQRISSKVAAKVGVTESSVNAALTQQLKST